MKKITLILIILTFHLSGFSQNNARFVSQQVPRNVLPGQTFQVSITMKNTGTTTWSPSANYRLGSQSPQDNTTWGRNRVDLTSDVPPGAEYTFIFDAQAPSTEGTYNFQWRMVQDGVEWFGDYTDLVKIRVDTVNDAEFVGFEQLPQQLRPGESFIVYIKMRNVGTTQWSPSRNYRLGSWYPQDNMTWGVNRVYLDVPVPPGDTAVFVAHLTAPSSEGLYNFQWRMVQDGVEWFGDPTELVFLPVMNDLRDSLFGPPVHRFSRSDRIIAATVFHWFTRDGGQVSGPWIPLNGRESWDGSVAFWKRMIKQLMRAGVDVLHVIQIPFMEEQRGNLFMALYQLRAEGWDVPKVCPFFDPVITYSLLGYRPDAATEEGKDEIVGHYIRFYKQYFAVNRDPWADQFIYTQDDRPVLNVWHVHSMIDHYDQLTRNDVTSRLASAFGTEHPTFYNPIVMITNEISPSFTFADEKVAQFELQEYYHVTDYNQIRTALLKPGYWDQNIRTPGYCLHRDGGIHYRNAWNTVTNNLQSLHRVQIESFNEYDEGSGIYAARTDTIYRAPGNTENDFWSDTDNPWEYIEDSYQGSKIFNMYPDYDASILWHNFPDTVYAGDTIRVRLIARNEGDNLWKGCEGYKFGQQEFQDQILFTPTRFPINDLLYDIPTYGGIFKGRAFEMEITMEVPDTSGTFLTHWGMVHEGHTWINTIEIPVTILRPTSGIENSQTFSYKIFPNPSSGIWTVEGQFEAGDRLVLQDLHGRILLTHHISRPVHRVKISVSIPEGVYILTGIHGDKKWSQKIIRK